MGEKELLQRPSHNLIMESRRILSLSGVKDVDSFDEESIILKTEMGELTVRGQKLHINHLDQESGELKVDGEICELLYSDKNLEKKSFFGRLLH